MTAHAQYDDNENVPMEDEEDIMAIITLSRGTYSGAKELAEYIAPNLGYKLLSRETIVDKLAEYGWIDEKLNKVRHKHLGILQRMNLEWIHYIACLRAVLSKEAQDEGLVYHGNNGHAALRGFPHILNIKVVADMKDRIRAVMARNEYAIDQKEAIRIIERIDERRKRWAEFLYQTDANDVSSFDMIIDLSRKSITDAYDMIHAAVALPQFQPTPESKKAIESLTRAAQLRARIAMETDIMDDEIEVEIHDGVLNVRGVVHSLRDAEELKRFLSSQPEVEKVESHLEKSPQSMNDM
jgi:cytidylate kinase